MKINLGIAFLLALLFAASGAYAAQEATIDKGTLIIKEVEVTIVKVVPDVPVGLSAHDALELVRAERSSALIHGERRKGYSVGFFSVSKTVETPRKIVRYRPDSGWVLSDIPPMVEESDDTFSSWLFIYVPGLVFGVLTFMNVFSGTGRRDLLIFYLLISLGAFAGGILDFWGVFLSMVMGAFAGYFATRQQGYDASAPGMIFGVLMGFGIGVCVAELTKTRNFEGILRYEIIMILIGGVSFAVALAARAVKEKVQTMIAAKGA